MSGLDHLVINVVDLDRSLSFYGDLPGMEVLRPERFRRGEGPAALAWRSPSATPTAAR